MNKLTQTNTHSPEILSAWRPLSQIQPSHIPKNVRPWLTDPASLTQKLHQLTQNKIELVLRFANWAQPLSQERKLLALAANETTWVRKIEWCYQQQPWILGRVIIPKATVTTTDTPWQQLAQRSIGEILFNDPAMTRHEFELCYQRQADQKIPNTWHRRSLFSNGVSQLIVTETFLPEFFEHELTHC